MHLGKAISISLLAGALLSGCASRLGYPARTVGIPTPVTLFSKITPKGVIQNTMPYMARDIWNDLYKDRFTKVLDGIPAGDLHRRLDIQFSNDARKATKVFTPSSSEVINIDVDYAKTKDDPKDYSGFDFTQYRDSIPTQYVLALTFDDWGLVAGQTDTTNGPFIALTIQLIDKDTNRSLWRYHYQWMQQVDKAEYDLMKSDTFQHILEKLIEHSVDGLFQWIGN